MAASEFVSFLGELFAASGEVLRRRFRAPLEVESKADDTPVTVADREAEAAMRAAIERRFPDHGILGEESGATRTDAAYQWILDPIDGTKSFITGAQTFGTLAALLKDGAPILGAIHQPILGELYVGDNERATLNGEPIRVRDVERVEEATVLSTDHYDFRRLHDFAGYERLAATARLYRNWGDCYGYALLSAGFADAMLDAEMSVWDLAALVPIVRGAGGVISGYDGGPIETATSCLATTPRLYPLVTRLLHGESLEPPPPARFAL
ncbi:MAG: histidinol-phosphatase [Ignavibacteriales bacterium]|nr:histidinol-phosphatase [Ignavibacteriales bacterium]